MGILTQEEFDIKKNRYLDCKAIQPPPILEAAVSLDHATILECITDGNSFQPPSDTLRHKKAYLIREL